MDGDKNEKGDEQEENNRNAAVASVEADLLAKRQQTSTKKNHHHNLSDESAARIIRREDRALQKKMMTSMDDSRPRSVPSSGEEESSQLPAAVATASPSSSTTRTSRKDRAAKSSKRTEGEGNSGAGGGSVSVHVGAGSLTRSPTRTTTSVEKDQALFMERHEAHHHLLVEDTRDRPRRAIDDLDTSEKSEDEWLINPGAFAVGQDDNGDDGDSSRPLQQTTTTQPFRSSAGEETTTTNSIPLAAQVPEEEQEALKQELYQQILEEQQNNAQTQGVVTVQAESIVTLPASTRKLNEDAKDSSDVEDEQGRKQKIFNLSVGAVICLVVIIVAVVLGVVLGSEKKDSGDDPSLKTLPGGGDNDDRTTLSPTPSPSNVPTLSPTSFAPTTRSEALLQFLDESLGRPGFSDIPEESTNNNTPLEQAKNWILFEDPAQLNVEDNGVFQRFLLVLFYFQTSAGSGWRSCGQGFVWEGSTSFCTFQRFNRNPEDGSISFTPVGGSIPWLSEHNECNWEGVLCERGGREVVGINIGKSR